MSIDVAAPVAPAPVATQPELDASTAAPTTVSASSEAGGVPTPGPAAGGPNNSLYVGELDQAVTEAMLYEIFSMVGPVASIRVCRDAVTRRSLGYAYVNYINVADGEHALEQLNYSSIKGRPCRIMWSQRDPALRRTGAGNVFIKNLDSTVDNKALHDTFAAFGKILSCKVAIDENGNSRGHGFVHYETAEAAEAAINAVNGMLLNERMVYVGLHIPRRERQAKIDEIRSRFTNIYVKNLPLDVTEEELNKMFSKYGTITSAALSVDADGKSRGFGFINFESHDEAKAAVDELHDSELRGQTLFVSRAQKKSERDEELRKQHEKAKYEQQLKYQGVNLYVKNLDDNLDDEQLQKEFSPFGTITSCKIMRDEKGVSKGFGFVCYSTPDEATKAISELNGKMVSSKPLYVALAQRKELRKQQLEAQAVQRSQLRNQQIAASGMTQVAGYIPTVGPQPMFGYQGNFQSQGRNMVFPQGNMPANMRPRYGPSGPNQGMPMPQYQQYPGQQLPPNARQGIPSAQNAGIPLGGRYPQTGAPIPGPVLAQGSQQQRPFNPINGRPNQNSRPGNGQRQGFPRQDNEQPSITAQAMANASPAEQKQMLGEAIYPKIFATNPELAGKITGMLLEMDNSELLNLIEDNEALDVKVQEAMVVLEEFNKTSTQ